jgi:hypothetical protein
MEKRIAVLHEGGLAQYSIREKKNGHFVARLLSYNGQQENEPPQEIDVHKEGRHWEDEGANQNLVDDIGLAIDYENRPPDQPVSHRNGEDSRNEQRHRDQQRGTGKP